MIHCQACIDRKHGIKGSPLTEHTCDLNRPFMPNWASRPGDTINDILSERGMGVEVLATKMEMPLADVLKLILAVNPINRKIAKKLSSVLGASEEFWLNREKQYRESLERNNLPQP